MPQFEIAELESAFRSSFSRDTCSEDDLPHWTPDNSARGHCAVASLTLHHLLGGRLLLAKVRRDGVQIGYHWWNRLPGIDLDLTRNQFAPDEVVGEPEVVERPRGPLKRYADQYETYRSRVFDALGLGDGDADGPSVGVSTPIRPQV